VTTLTESDVIEVRGQITRMWWLFLVTGIAWTLIAFAVLATDANTPALIGLLTGFVLLLAGLNEFVAIAFTSGWRWLHGVLGALFSITGIMALVEPLQTFGILALLVGWYLMLKGIADIVVSIADRHRLPLWGLLLASGIIELAVGVWAIGYPGRSSWLLIVWVGLAALVRGVTEIVLAFQLRSGRVEAA
jgi:uncharacterized membrane protein HdeD (DUF308 family)